MEKDQFRENLEQLTDFSYARFASYPVNDDGVERGIWARVFQALNNAQRELFEDE